MFADKLQGQGLRTLLDTTDFGCWHAAVKTSLGHHRSQLLSSANHFEARMRAGQVDGIGVIHLQGIGELELEREQCDNAVLWLPICGSSEEWINGQAYLAEPGKALLFWPGDHLHGRTALEVEGVSILLPQQDLPPLENTASPLLDLGRGHQQLLAAARDVAMAAAQEPQGACWAAEQLRNSLISWAIGQGADAPKERITAVRRRAMVGEARKWLEAHLGDRFTVGELSAAVGVSTRQLQYSFLEELGCTPMADAKRLRLHRLRQLLLDPELHRSSVAELMTRSGLLASGVTAADYRAWFGELPRQTRQRQPFFSQDLRSANN